MLVEKIGDAAGERNAASDEIAGSDIEARVARIMSQAEAEEIAIGANAAEIAGEIQVPLAIGSIEDEVSRVDGTAKKMIAGHLNGIEGVGGFQDARVVMGVVAIKAEPSAKAQFARKIDAAGTCQIGVEIRAGALLAGGSRCGIESETDDVAEAIVEISGGESKALTGEKLVETGVIGLAALGAKGGIAWETRIAAERLLKSGLLEALTVGKTGARVAPEAAAIVKSVDNAGPGHNAGAEGRIGLGAGSGAEGEAR